MSEKKTPPPVIGSARLVSFAYTDDDDVEFTDRINLYVGRENRVERLGKLPHLAICADYGNCNEFLLLFCNEEWESQGVIAFGSIEEAKLKAERGYRGITHKWHSPPYTTEQVDDYLRDVYEVDPRSEWWKDICSFCGKSASETRSMIVGQRACICRACALSFCASFTEENGV